MYNLSTDKECFKLSSVIIATIFTFFCGGVVWFFFCFGFFFVLGFFSFTISNFLAKYSVAVYMNVTGGGGIELNHDS